MINISGIENRRFDIKEDDKLAVKLGMLIEGECYGVKAALKKYGYTEQRYYQLLKIYKELGAEGLVEGKRGPHKPSLRKRELVNQIIRQRFLDPQSSAEVISQKMKQNGYNVSIRSVERTITEYGLQKKRIVSTQKTTLTKKK